MTCNGQVALEMCIFLYSALFEDPRCLKWASSAWRLDSWEVSAGALLSTERHISFMEISSKCSKRWKHYYTADPIISFNNSTSETSQVWKQRAKTMPRAPSGRDVWGSTADVSKGGEYRFSCSIKFRLKQTKNTLRERAPNWFTHRKFHGRLLWLQTPKCSSCVGCFLYQVENPRSS